MKSALPALILLVLLCAVLSTGCSATVKEIRGAQAEVRIIQDTHTLETYKHVAVDDVESDLGPECSREMIDALRREMYASLAALNDSIAEDEPVLRAETKVDYYQKGGGVKALLGKEARCHVRIRLLAHDGDDDLVLADLLIPSASGAIIRSKHEHLAKAITESFVEYLQERGLRAPPVSTEPPDTPTTRPASETKVAASK